MSKDYEFDYDSPDKYYINPHEHCGIVLDAYRAEIPGIICREIARVGGMDLWAFQDFVHHEHPGTIEDGLECLETWRKTLTDRFPEFRFVIEIDPCFRATWYQATQSAQSEDDQEWKPYLNSLGFTAEEWRTMTKEQRAAREAACHKCRAQTEFTEPEIHPDCRGVMVCKCPLCGHPRIHSTRIIRERVNW